MKKTEIILIAIFIIGLLFMVFSFPGQNILMIVGLGLLATIYTFLGFALLNNIRLRNIFKKESYKGISVLRIIGSILAGISLAITLDGILFKIMFWPGANVMLVEGIIFLVIISIIGAIKYSKNKSDFYPRVLKRTLVVSFIGIILFLLPGEKLAHFKYRNHPEYAKALIDSWSNPDNIQYQEKLREEGQKMNEE